ncbi:ELMO domain-containing protein 2 isoform X2 [Varanus komodoensis]|uniref:ELMO domain containing 2 n=2 Tax=Varanus komodoensis TaxID=61221 RepID=A0A8D2ISA8_VARKO|nr:ELMO domain-containing protein 2 isoform X2 [Varanus komodoensis]XP_044286701.1 ELMO domain-containing protein 2 isoform X2 [Varanus komodoensis]XP_044286702.1 ELMO domain-containing protein 2 isoform X2 [Varanus komodoensis]XP_044286703.1 ELMO domain-containing protein 2 isoform X2 [Varanus komodoensis]XP_044286704.1 ELMO domain-containing protein 2 isoform X2 [Varanus komodoensis]
MIIQLWRYLYTNIFRFWIKWFLRQLTGKCELQRICDGSRKNAERTLKIEHSLETSKCKALQKAVCTTEEEVAKCVAEIIQKKKINIQKDTTFALKLQLCLLQISGCRKLYLAVEELRKQPYNSDNKEHEEQLMELWNLLMPHEKLKARITKQWCDVGFQGDDPKTDFRGMGMLGLINLLYFSKHYPREARQILSRSNNPKLGYSYAIVGINLTEMAYSLLKNGFLKVHFYNLVAGVPQMKDFHQFYCYLAYKFDQFWFDEKPESIMYFNQYREKFHAKVKKQLQDYDTVLALKNEKS